MTTYHTIGNAIFDDFDNTFVAAASNPDVAFDIAVALNKANAPEPIEPTPEPDPWPTAPLIVADWIATGTAKGHGLLYLDGHEYVTVKSGHVLREGRDTLTNPVPVTVVPVAEWEAWRAYVTEEGPPCGDDAALLEATDALEVDL